MSEIPGNAGARCAAVESEKVVDVEEPVRRRNGVQPIEVGADLLRALAALARAANMTSGKAHRYLVSYSQSGLVAQSERNGTYDLGPSPGPAARRARSADLRPPAPISPNPNPQENHFSHRKTFSAM